MQLYRFDKAAAHPAHEGSIWSAPLFPENIQVPFEHAWGYVDNGRPLAAHMHDYPELYLITQGLGIMQVGDEKADIGPGDVILIPPHPIHSIRQSDQDPLTWLAFWWQA